MRKTITEVTNVWMCGLKAHSAEPECEHRVEVPHLQSFCDKQGTAGCDLIRKVRVMVIDDNATEE